MSETTDFLLEGLYKTVTINVRGRELPFKFRRLSVLELAGKTSLIGSMIPANGKKPEEEDNSSFVECMVWAIEAACVDPCFSSKEEDGKILVATLPSEASVELATEIFRHCGLMEGMKEAGKVRHFSAGDGAGTSSPQT